MKHIQLYAAGIAVAAVPAIAALTGTSFSQPVHRVEQPVAASAARTTATPSPTAAPSHDANDDRGRRHGGRGADDGATHDAGDDHGRRHGGRGADDGADHDAGDDHGGRHHGGDDRGGDDHGGHGSDD
jgi:hypothetical protein